MPVNKRKNKRTKREQRRARHNQKNKKEGTVMTENINGITDSTMAETVETEETKAAEVAEDKDTVDMANGTAEVNVADTDTTKVNTETIETEAECPVVEDNEVENKKAEDVTVKKEISHKLYIQYNDLEFSDELMFEAAVNAYCNEHGQDKSSVETVNLYVKPQEGKAYYVINNDAEKTGSIDL